MSKDAQDMSFANAAAQRVMYAPLDPVGFYATGHPEPPIYAIKNTEKRPRSASTAHVEPESAKKPKPKNNNKENKPPTRAVKAKKEQAAIREASAAAAVDRDEILASSRWSTGEKSRLFLWLLGADADGRFNKLKKNPGYIFKKVI